MALSCTPACHRPGTAQVTFKDARSASAALLKFDGSCATGTHRPLRVSSAQVFSRAATFADADDNGDNEKSEAAEAEDLAAMVPLSFASRGTKEQEEKERRVQRKWRSVFCRHCGLRLHNSEGCPLTLKSFHQQIVDGEASVHQRSSDSRALSRRPTTVTRSQTSHPNHDHRMTWLCLRPSHDPLTCGERTGGG